MEIEKLGITPIRAVPMFKGQSDCDICKADEVREKEKVFNEILEALIEATILTEKEISYIESLDRSMYKCHSKTSLIAKLEKNTSIIEKACHPKTWDEIKAIL